MDTWKIWHEWYNDKGELIGSGVSYKGYKRKGNAERAAAKRFGDNPNVKYFISKTNPWQGK